MVAIKSSRISSIIEAVTSASYSGAKMALLNKRNSLANPGDIYILVVPPTHAYCNTY